MEGGMDADTCLEYATIQIFPSKNRYETFICGHDEVEKLATGNLELLLPHLPGVNNLNSKGTNAIFKLQVTGETDTASWFTKSTLNRFLQLIGPNDLVNTSKTIEGEISQLQEARKFHLSLYAQGKQGHQERGEADGFNSGMESTLETEENAIPSDTSKNELLRAMDLRLTALRSKLMAALNHAVGATCSSKDVTDLVKFCEHFGATGLKNSLCKVLKLCNRSVIADDNILAAEIDDRNRNDDIALTSKPAYSVQPVKYGASPAKAAHVERQSSTESEDSSKSSDEKDISAERSRSTTRSALSRRSASPMRRIQIGRSGSHRAAALTIKSLNYYPARERTSQRDGASSSEDEGPERPVSKLENNVRRMSVQDKINLFERKQKDQTTDAQIRSSTSNVSLFPTKSVLRRWSAGIADCSGPCQQELVPDEAGPLHHYDTVDREVSNNLAEEKMDSDFTYKCQNPVDTNTVDVESERWEQSAQDPVGNERDTNATHGEETNRNLAASAEWSRQKELELNQMLMKMMESQPRRSRKSETNMKQSATTEQRGGFYDHYKDKRDKKLRGEDAEKKAEKEAQFRSMQKILDKRKAEMVSKNVKGVGKITPSPKPQKALNNPPQSANPRNGSPKTAVTKKVSSKSSTLPATRKSWPSSPSSRAAVSSPSKVPTAVSSAGSTPTGRKPQSSLPRTSAKVEKPQPCVRNLKESQTAVERKSLNRVKETKQQTVQKRGKIMKPKAAASSGDNAVKVSPNPKVTKKSSVVPLESKPLQQKRSGTSPVVRPTLNKTKHSSQSVSSSLNCESTKEARDNELIADTGVLVSEGFDKNTEAFVHFDASVELETAIDSNHCCGVEETLNTLSPGGNGSFKGKTETSELIQPQEESVISPTAWVEIEEQQEQSTSCNDGTSQPNSPVRNAPIVLSSPYTRHSLSQMLQEEDNNSEPDTNEWGNAENPPAVVYQKESPKGFKRLLKFARKNKGDANLTGWSSPSVYSEGEDDAEESRAISKKNNDNQLRKAALHSRDYGQRHNTSSFEGYGKKMNVHELLSAQSNPGKLNIQSTHKLNKSNMSTTASTAKASRSFFSLSAFRGSKPNDTKLQ